jgi:hypothetical protein
MILCCFLKSFFLNCFSGLGLKLFAGCVNRSKQNQKKAKGSKSKQK